MSYCRWSSDFGECDVYVYEDANGWVTHVARRRLKHKVPEHIKSMFPVEFSNDWTYRYMEYVKAESEWRRSLPGPGDDIADSEYIDLEGPYAGESFYDATPQECAERLEDIRQSGLNVPQYAIDALREEYGQ